jgi:hypothetical protein
MFPTTLYRHLGSCRSGCQCTGQRWRHAEQYPDIQDVLLNAGAVERRVELDDKIITQVRERNKKELNHFLELNHGYNKYNVYLDAADGDEKMIEILLEDASSYEFSNIQEFERNVVKKMTNKKSKQVVDSRF